MSRGLNATFDYLAKTENQKARDILVAAIDSKHPLSRQQAVRAILERLDPSGHAEVFRRLTKMDKKCNLIVTERCGRLVNVVKQTLAQGGHESAAAACDAVLKFRLYDVLPALLATAEKENAPEAELAAKTTLALAESFYAEMSGAYGRPRQDVENVRRRMTSALEAATRKYSKHKSLPIVEAFLLVAKPSNPTLRTLLHSPQDSAHPALVEAMEKSTHGGVVRLLLGFLEDSQMPRHALRVLCNRTDAKYVENLLDKARPGRVRTKALNDTLYRFTAVAWAKPSHPTLSALDGELQHAAVELLAATSVDEPQILDVLEYLLADGKVEGRRAAAKTLANFSGSRADKIAVKALSDADDEVRGHILKQLRPRNIPGAMSLLIRMVDNPSEPVRAALAAALPEFSFRHFIANFDILPEESRPLGGQVVRRIDLETETLLAAELCVLSPVRRRRAVNAALVMGLVQQLESKIVPLLADPDHMVRVAAAQALAECDTATSWESLREALCDRSVVVQEAAERSLMQISQSLILDCGDNPEDTQTGETESRETYSASQAR